MLVLENPAEFEVRVSNRVVENITVGQVVRIKTTTIKHCSVTLHLQVFPYALTESGELGAPLPPGFVDVREIALVADNTTLVDAPVADTPGRLRYWDDAPGQVFNYLTLEHEPLPLAELPEHVPPRPVTLAEFGRKHADTLALQGDLFEEMKKYPQIIEDMQRQHIQAADALGRFA